jgi:hypothetical protein
MYLSAQLLPEAPHHRGGEHNVANGREAYDEDFHFKKGSGKF